MGPRYRYLKLRVSCYEARDFGIDQMRAAVEYLKSVPMAGSKHVGLIAVAKTVKAGDYLLDATPMLTLGEITGKTPGEVWAMFDAGVDDWREGLIHGHSAMMK